MEFHGCPCIALEEMPLPKKRIGSSKGFRHLVSSKEVLKEAMSTYITRTAEKVRELKLAVEAMRMWIDTDPFREDLPQYDGLPVHYTFPEATDYTPYLVAIGNRGIDLLYKPGFLYKRVGVEYIELADANAVQQNLYWRTNVPKQKVLMATLDRINKRLGRGKLRLAAEGYNKEWTTKFVSRSRNYTTSLDELPVVKAS
jgi:DNA polymerase V